jgi:hypothetical protein
MKPFNSSLAGLAVLIFSGAANVSVQSQSLEIKPLSGQSFQLVQSPKGYSFDTGQYNFQARTQQTNGLYRGVMIHSRSKDPMSPGESIMAYAKFARRDKKVVNRWVLGDVVLHTYNNDGSPKSKSIVKRLILDIT